MSGQELSNLLGTAAAGCQFVEGAFPPDVCSVGIALLGAFSSAWSEEGAEKAAASLRIADARTWKLIGKLIQVLQGIKDANEQGSFGDLAETCKRLQERKRMLNIIGRFIRESHE